MVKLHGGSAEVLVATSDLLSQRGHDEERAAHVHGWGQQDGEGDSGRWHVGRGEVRRAVPGAARCRALGRWDGRGPAPGTWSRLEHLTPGWGLIFYANSCLQRARCCGSWYCRARRRAAERLPALKASSDRARGRAGWLQPARRGTARLCPPRAPPSLCAAEAPGQGSAAGGTWPSPATAWVRGIRAGNTARLCRSPCWRPSPVRPGLRLSKPRASSGARATEPPSPRGDGQGAPARDAARSLLPCPLTVKLSKPPSSEAVCLQLDRSSASPACLLRFLILGVGLSKSRAEPPRDQGEAGGASSSKFLFFFLSFFFFPSSFTLHTKPGYDETPAPSCSQHSCTAHAGNNCPWWSSASCRVI
ncbi:uncharacterized protein LOC142418077 isoform X2 [Mycteria americana]|uniref:uncharacterized protein LOC142418077 isoform X2 n=1 Tax=Mycteria americana TaxID=33587 RepID=UPI003F58098F